LKEAIDAYLKKRGFEKKIKEKEVISIWREVVGEEVEKHAKPFIFKKGRLHVLTSSPIWIQELTMRKEEIIKKINEKLGEEVVKEIFFRIGEVK